MKKKKDKTGKSKYTVRIPMKIIRRLIGSKWYKIDRDGD